VGEDCLVLSSQGFPFSVAVASKTVKVLHISKANMVKTLPYTYQRTLAQES